MDFRKKFLVEPHVKFELGNIDPAYKGTHEIRAAVASDDGCFISMFGASPATDEA